MSAGFIVRALYLIGLTFSPTGGMSTAGKDSSGSDTLFQLFSVMAKRICLRFLYITIFATKKCTALRIFYVVNTRCGIFARKMLYARNANVLNFPNRIYILVNPREEKLMIWALLIQCTFLFDELPFGKNSSIFVWIRFSFEAILLLQDMLIILKILRSEYRLFIELQFAKYCAIIMYLKVDFVEML